MARLAFLTSGNRNLVFANGFGKTVSPPEYEVFRGLCASRAAHEDLVRSMLEDAGGGELFRWLVTNGAFDVPTEQPGDVT
jgi:hypothetical protein